MERRTPLGVHYSNEALGISDSVYPLNFHFLEEGSERPATRKDAAGLVVGYASACYKGGLDGQVLFFNNKETGIEAVHKDTVVYERKVTK